MKWRGFFVALAVVSILALTFIPMNGIEATAPEETDVSIVSYADHLELNAGTSNYFTVIITNTLAYSSDASLDNDRAISVSISSGNGNVSATPNIKNFILGGQDYQEIIITVEAGKYASTGTYTLTINLEIMSLDSSDYPIYMTKDIGLKISSALSAGSEFNKILGVWENPLPEPFNSPAATAIISFVLWVLIGLIIVMIALPILVHILNNGNNKEEKVKLGIMKLLMTVVLIWAVSKSLRVYGASESMVDTFQTWFYVLYIILGAVIVWKLFIVFIEFSLRKIDANLNMNGNTSSDDLRPLLHLLGKLFIAVFAVAMAMAAFGFNLTAIITSAGIVSLGITLGAQNVLNQFFSGLVLLITHPFKAGDLVHIGTSSTTYKVSKVDIMNTVFKNWANEETIIMPNNTVASSTIINLTDENLTYKVNVFVGIAYGEDINKATNIMRDVGMKHPDAIIDGSTDKPYTRVVELQDSSINLRLSVYVKDYNRYGIVEGELRQQIYEEFIKAGINIPFPQMDVHLDYKNNEKE